MDEIWAKILGFPKYSVSTHGRIRNDVRERLVKQSCTMQGMSKVGLMKDGKQHTKSVKLLVASAFVTGQTDIFDSPINLDGDQRNNHIANLVWRPAWFAWKYTSQFKTVDEYATIGPIVDRHTGLLYENIVSAATTNGLLFYEIKLALVNKVPVFPTWHLFDWYKET